MKVSIPYGKGKVEEAADKADKLVYQFPMGKVKLSV